MDAAFLTKHIDWLRMKGRAQKTIEGRSGEIRRLAGMLGTNIEDATRVDLIAWRVTLNGLADASILCKVSHIRCYYQWLVDEEQYRADNPARPLPTPRKPLYLPRPIDDPELYDALDQAPSRRIRIWLVLGGWCGMRPVEIALLRRRNIREHATQPHIFIAADATKGNRERTIPLSQFVIDELRLAALPATGWAFPGGQGGHVSPHRVSELCNDYLHGLGLADVFYSFRHRFGTAVLQGSGGNLRVAQTLLGHARPETTAVYTLVTSPEAAAAVANIPSPRRLKTASLIQSGEDNATARAA